MLNSIMDWWAAASAIAAHRGFSLKYTASITEKGRLNCIYIYNTVFKRRIRSKNAAETNAMACLELESRIVKSGSGDLDHVEFLTARGGGIGDGTRVGCIAYNGIA